MVEYRLAKARVAGSNPVSCSCERSGNVEFISVSVLFCVCNLKTVEDNGYRWLQCVLYGFINFRFGERGFIKKQSLRLYDLGNKFF